MIRLGLRPIDEMAATADAIAEGDLSRRVEVGPATHRGRPAGLALNGMLHQIEGAFAERQASRTGSAGSWPTPPTSCGRR